jgi:hypothetical protein
VQLPTTPIPSIPITTRAPFPHFFASSVLSRPCVPPILDQEDKSWQYDDCPHGLVYSDGTILLFSEWGIRHNNPPRFRAALLWPGDAAWTVVERSLGSFEYD